MKYMLLVYLDEQALDEAEREECYGESAQLAQELNSSGQYLGANPLHPTSTATSVRMRNGKRLVTAPQRRGCRDPRAARRLLPDRGQKSRRGDRHRGANSNGMQGHHRNPAVDGDRGPAGGELMQYKLI